MRLPVFSGAFFAVCAVLFPLFQKIRNDANIFPTSDVPLPQPDAFFPVVPCNTILKSKCFCTPSAPKRKYTPRAARCSASFPPGATVTPRRAQTEPTAGKKLFHEMPAPHTGRPSPAVCPLREEHQEVNGMAPLPFPAFFLTLQTISPRPAALRHSTAQTTMHTPADASSPKRQRRRCPYFHETF